MRTRGRMRPLALTVVFALAGTATGTGQDRPDDRSGPPMDGAQENPLEPAWRGLILEREVYTYPARGRRDPFLPLDLRARRGPRADEIRLLGIIHHPDPLYRVAVIGLYGGSDRLGNGEGRAAAETTSRLRVGEVAAGLRVTAIEIDHVIVEMEEPGGTAPRKLAMPRPAQGRGS